jgi:phycoerythrin-associated linker protein
MTAPVLELRRDRAAVDVANVVRAAYKQVLGNPHVMESERLVTAESQLANGDISVREFVRAIGKSEFYRSRYFEKCSPYRFVELNFMHFLGRAPQSQAEISEHIVRCVAEGYDAEIDSYINSDEYQALFGDNNVPVNRGAATEVGQRQVTYNRMFALDRGPAQVSSSVKASQVGYAVATNSTNKIKPAAVNLSGSGDAGKKTFKIVVSGSKLGGSNRRSVSEYLVPGDRMSSQIQRIHRTGSKIVSITEV